MHQIINLTPSSVILVLSYLIPLSTGATCRNSRQIICKTRTKYHTEWYKPRTNINTETFPDNASIIIILPPTV